MNKPVQSEIRQAFQRAEPYLNMGYVLIGSIGLFGFIGYWLDQKFNIKPLGILTGLFLGLALGFYHLIKSIQDIAKRLVFTGGALGYLKLVDFDVVARKSLQYAMLLSTANVIIAFMIARKILNYPQERFNKIFFISMGIRLLILLVLIFVILKFGTVNDFVFITGLIILHFSMQIWEVYYLNLKIKEGK